MKDASRIPYLHHWLWHNDGSFVVSLLAECFCGDGVQSLVQARLIMAPSMQFPKLPKRFRAINLTVLLDLAKSKRLLVSKDPFSRKWWLSNLSCAKKQDLRSVEDVQSLVQEIIKAPKHCCPKHPCCFECEARMNGTAGPRELMMGCHQ